MSNNTTTLIMFLGFLTAVIIGSFIDQEFDTKPCTQQTNEEGN